VLILMIYVKNPNIIFKVLNFEFIISYLFLLTTLRTKLHIQFSLFYASGYVSLCGIIIWREHNKFQVNKPIPLY
jgi:hypothetical protein